MKEVEAHMSEDYRWEIYGSDVDLSWTAGFLEGEGSFLVNHNSGRDRRSYPRVVATQADGEMLERLQGWFGGSVRRDDRGEPHRSQNHFSKRPIFVWTLTGDNSLRLMLALRPFMSRRRQAQIDRVFDIFGDRVEQLRSVLL